jgi:hypothetical protein
MTKEAFRIEVFNKAVPNYLNQITELTNINRTGLMRDIGSERSFRRPDPLFLYALGNLLYTSSISSNQQKELNARFGPDFCKQLITWFNTTSNFLNTLSRTQGQELGRLKDYLPYLK